ncbi:hypothetical protein HDE_09210 [Halotydeus destructor]|nr:hypothetical protein HDE_09210 [Halotydeus destructor]
MIDRFGGRVPSAPCRIGVGNSINLVTKVDHGQERDSKGQRFFEFCTNGLDHLNCSIVYMDNVLTGTPDENGTFDGTIGYMQRNEIDYGIPVIRIDTLDHEIVRIGPVLSPADLIIISVPKSASKIQLDLCDVFDNVTSTFKLYLLIVIAIVAAAIYGMKNRFKPADLVRLIQRLKDIIWKIVELFVDQENYGTREKFAMRTLWSIFAFSVYVIVYCYLVSYISADEVASKPLDTIDSIEDHLSLRFNHIEPIVLRNSMSYPLLSTADPRSSIGRLFAKVAVSRDTNIIDLGSADPHLLMDIFKRGFDAENMVSFIVEKFAWHTVVKGVMCSCDGNKMARVHESRRSFANGVMTAFFNRKASPEFTKYAEYRYRILSESYLSQQALRQVSEAFIISTTGAISLNSLRCWDSESRPEYDNTVKPTSMRVLGNTVRLYAVMLGLSILVLTSEHLLYMISRLLLYSSTSATSQKVLERFGGRLPSAPCRLGVGNPSNMATKVEEGQERDASGQLFFEFCTNGLDHLNCSIVYMDSVLTGTPDDNGTFDGTIGYIQRDEIDYGIPVIRIDTLDHEIIRIGPVLSPADMIIVSVPKSAEKINLDLCDVFDHMTAILKLYLLIVIVIVAAVIYGLKQRFKLSRKPQILKLIHQLKDIIWRIIELFVDQENYGTREKFAMRIFWSIFAFSVYVIVYGYLVNYISADGVASKPIDTIDSIYDHLSARFKHIEPMLMRNSMSYPLLSAAEPHSSIGRLYAKAAADEDRNIVDMGSADPQVMMDLFKRGFDAENMVSLLSEKFVWDSSIKGVMCSFDSAKMSRVHVSSQSFANGVLATFFNKLSAPEFTKYAEYRFRILTESYLSQQVFRHVSEALISRATGTMSLNVLRCWDDDRLVEHDDTVKPTSMTVLANTLRLCIVMLSLSVLVVILELTIASFLHSCQSTPKAKGAWLQTAVVALVPNFPTDGDPVDDK